MPTIHLSHAHTRQIDTNNANNDVDHDVSVRVLGLYQRPTNLQSERRVR